jgi:Spy/CpxP family protein refolding chaperone
VLCNTFKRMAAAGIAAVVLGGSAVGLASAQGTTMTPMPGDTQQTPGQEHHGRGFERGVALGMAAQAIGITPQQLRTELPGKSLAQVAQAHGKNPADIATGLKNAANERINQEVTEGKLTADQAAQRQQTVDARIDQAVNRVVPVRQPGATPGTTPVPMN